MSVTADIDPQHYGKTELENPESEIKVLETQRILIVEDDPDIGELLALHLGDVYSHVELCNDGLMALELVRNEPWDLILLDIRLPGLDGLEVCRRIRANENFVPIIMLTSKVTELDHVLGLEMGADDYVCKPFSVVTLLSRVKAMIRREQRRDALQTAEQTAGPEVIKHGQIEILKSKRQVAINGNLVQLTAKEFDLLYHFACHPGEVFSRADLLDHVWGYGHEGYEHTVNSHINRLRLKIEDSPAAPRYIITVWGVGYKLGD